MCAFSVKTNNNASCTAAVRSKISSKLILANCVLLFDRAFLTYSLMLYQQYAVYLSHADIDRAVFSFVLKT